MKDYKLIRVLDQLNNKDIHRLHRFLDSPYFDHKSNNALFIKGLSNFQNINENQLSKIWNRLFKVRLNENRLRKKLHECLLIVEKFLALENYIKSPLQQSKNLLDEAVNKNIDELIPKGVKYLESELDKHKELTFDYYFYRFKLFDYLIFIKDGFHRKIEIKRNKDSSEYLLKADKIINEIFLQEKLRLAHRLNEDNAISNRKDELTFVEEVKKFSLKTSRSNSKPRFYLNLMELQESSNKLERIEALYMYLNKRKSLFSKFEMRFVTTTLLNETIRLINIGNREAFKLTFLLYQTGLSNDIFFHKGFIPPDYFRNIVSTACALNHFEWAFDFIKNYKNKVNPEFQKTAVAFNLALVYRQIGDYEKVVSNLMSVEYEDLSYSLRSKGMLLTAYYELGEYDALDSLIKSFNVFLRRKTNISEKRKASFKNFNSTLQDIVRAKERRDKIKLKTVRRKLESKMTAPNKSWLLEKVEELEKEFGVK